MKRAATTGTPAAADASRVLPRRLAQDYLSGADAASPHRTRVSAVTVPALCPRLVTMQEAARMIGLSYWTFRALVFAGEVRAVRLPSARRPGRDSRRVWIDTRDLDAFIDRCKE